MLVSTIPDSVKEPALLGELADSRTRAGNTQDEPRASYSGKKGKECSKTTHIHTEKGK